MKHNNKNNKEKRDNFEVMAREIIKYIEFHGGKCVVIGGISVRERPPLKMNYTFEINFTGKPPVPILKAKKR